MQTEELETTPPLKIIGIILRHADFYLSVQEMKSTSIVNHLCTEKPQAAIVTGVL